MKPRGVGRPNRGYRHSKSKGRTKAPQWVEIRSNVKVYTRIEGALGSIGYTISHARRRWQVCRDMQQDSESDLSPDIHEEDVPVTPTARPSNGPSSPATHGNFIVLAKKIRAKSGPVPRTIAAKAFGTLHAAGHYVAAQPTCGPHPMLSPALKRSGTA